MSTQNTLPLNLLHEISAFIDRTKRARHQARVAKMAHDRMYNELTAMSDRDLADIGIHRSEIPRVAAEEAAKK